MMTVAQMNRISKQATAAELKKLHESIAEDPSLARQYTRKSSSSSAGSESSFSPDTSESEEEQPKNLTLEHLFFCNQNLQKKKKSHVSWSNAKMNAMLWSSNMSKFGSQIQSNTYN